MAGSHKQSAPAGADRPLQGREQKFGSSRLKSGNGRSASDLADVRSPPTSAVQPPKDGAREPPLAKMNKGPLSGSAEAGRNDHLWVISAETAGRLATDCGPCSSASRPVAIFGGGQ